MKKKIISLLLAMTMTCTMLAGCGSTASAPTEKTETTESADAKESADSLETTGDTIKIGISGPTTGDSAESGVNVNTGIQMAIDEFNEAGGVTIDGVKKKIEAVYYDTGSDAQTGLSNCEKLITSDKVDFLWCESFNSAVGVATMELAKKYDIPMATLEPVSSAITEKVASDPEGFSNFFKFGWDSDAYGDTCANTILTLVESGKLDLPNKTIALCGDETDYGRSNLAAVAAIMKDNGYTVVSENYWEFGATDLYSIISDVKSSNADVIFSCSTTAATGVAFIKQLKENGLGSVPHMAIYYPLLPEFVSQIGSQADGLLCAPKLIDIENNQSDAEFAEKVKDYCGDEMTFDHLDGYSDMKVVLEAMDAAGSVAADKLGEKLLSEDGYDVPKGHIKMNPDTHTIYYGAGYVPINAAQIQDDVSYIIYPEENAVSTFQTIE